MVGFFRNSGSSSKALRSACLVPSPLVGDRSGKSIPSFLAYRRTNHIKGCIFFWKCAVFPSSMAWICFTRAPIFLHMSSTDRFCLIRSTFKRRPTSIGILGSNVGSVAISRDIDGWSCRQYSIVSTFCISLIGDSLIKLIRIFQFRASIIQTARGQIMQLNN